jgi:ribosomal protein S4
MSSGNVYKPRYTLPYLAKSKVWPTKNSRLRRFISLRGRRLQRGGLFRRYVLVLKTIKWSEARRQIRPVRRRTGYGIAGGGRTAFGRPRKRRYRDSFYTKQQIRVFHGKRSEEAFRSLAQANRTGVSPRTGSRTRSFAASLGSRLDRLLFRRRIRPTIYSCHQFIRHVGVSVNGVLTYAPQSTLRVGDTISVRPAVGSVGNKIRLERWRTLYWDLFVRLYYRRWGLFILRRRTLSQLRAKVRLFSRPTAPRFPLTLASTVTIGRSQQRPISFSNFQTIVARLSTTKSFTPDGLKQFRHLLKVWLALRLRASIFPRLRSVSFFSGPSASTFSQYVRPSRRKNLRRFRITRRIKVERRRKLIRLQAIHILFPSYLQIDLRTLRATKISEPTNDELFFPFLGSVAQVQAFYRSRGI